MGDQILAKLLKAEEEAGKAIAEASDQADKIRESSNVIDQGAFDDIVASCKKQAEQSKELAKKKAVERSERVMEECNVEVAKLKTLGEKNMPKAAELILKEVISAEGED